MRALLLCMAIILAGAAGAFWAGNHSTGWAASVCSEAPVSCSNWDTFGYAAVVTLIGYLAVGFRAR
jgi:hypothetical protein